ncbi:MAG: class II D-tagatose-bisphosphate aldolase, non-catalytic subunit [Gemmataceae bacterium]|nr:class II D-tagatose-bisphosphate aldolase, non-catalytic subunit [Gemmataceae bacterium]
MNELNDVSLNCPTFDEFIASYNAAIDVLSPETARRLCEIHKDYFSRYGLEGAYERMKNRTIAQIFSEHQPGDVKPVAAGEREGVRWSLYDGDQTEQEKE